MSSIEYTTEPLSSGKYYLVDISEAIDEYYAASVTARMSSVSNQAEFSQADILDIELSAIIPCLDNASEATDYLKDHVKDLLEDGVELLRMDLETKGIDCTKRVIPNSADQLEHSQIVYNLGNNLLAIFKERGLYPESTLLGEHCSLLEHGVLVLRDCYNGNTM